MITTVRTQLTEMSKLLEKNLNSTMTANAESVIVKLLVYNSIYTNVVYSTT